jgi:hypothetical protein
MQAIIIKAVTLVHNSSVALLHEILSIVHFSSKDKERIKFMSSIQLCPMVSTSSQVVLKTIDLFEEQRTRQKYRRPF